MTGGNNYLYGLSKALRPGVPKGTGTQVTVYSQAVLSKWQKSGFCDMVHLCAAFFFIHKVKLCNVLCLKS